jgi:hypothetical protein
MMQNLLAGECVPLLSSELIWNFSNYLCKYENIFALNPLEEFAMFLSAIAIF